MLDLFFRKYAWTANLLILFVAAWFTARMVNTLVGALIRPRPQADLSTPSAAPRQAPALVIDDGDRQARHPLRAQVMGDALLQIGHHRRVIALGDGGWGGRGHALAAAGGDQEHGGGGQAGEREHDGRGFLFGELPSC